MTFFVERETDIILEGVDIEPDFREVVTAALKRLGCPYEATVNLTLIDAEGIRELNRDFREIDAPTDVLSFPMVDYDSPADFSGLVEGDADCFDPETGELLLGDIVLNLERVKSQAADYGHSEKREFSFLILHSVLHLLGFDHESSEEEEEMFALQEELLNSLNILR